MLGNSFRSMRLWAALLMPFTGILTCIGADISGPVPMQPAALHARFGCLSGTNSAFGSSTSFASPPHLNYYGGRVISKVRIVMVLYGTGVYGAFITNDAAPSMALFYQQVVTSSYIDWLCEYSTPTETIGRGSYGGKFIITPSASNNGSTIDDSNIQSELAAQIAAGHLPAPDTNTLYMLHFPQGKSITSGGFASCVIGGFCAYHSTALSRAGTEIVYGVMPDMTASLCSVGCGGGPTIFDNQCSVASHEMIESITDPEVGFATVFGPPLSWYDPVYGEIGDICNAQQETFTGTDGHTYTVQAGWSDVANACIASRPILAPVANAQNVTNHQGGPITITLTGGDPNVCAHPLTFTVTANPLHGTLSGAPPAITYLPAADFVGQDTFAFKVNNTLLDSSPATVNVFLVATNVAITLLQDRNLRLHFATIPGWPYRVLATDYLTNPIPWEELLSTNSGTNTTLVFDDLTSTNHPQRFYRTATP